MTLDAFLASVEGRAFRMARLSTRSDTEALDIVQEAMMKLVNKYRERGESEWPLLFQRILQNSILDWHRQQTRRKRLFWWGNSDNQDTEEEDEIEAAVDPIEGNPAHLLSRAEDIQHVMHAIEQLPVRQQQAFLLRAWEGFDTADTARIMQCTDGSVKTHYSRALARLRTLLEASYEKA